MNDPNKRLAAVVFAAAFIFTAGLTAADLKLEKKVRSAVDGLTAELISIRRDIHANPELGLQEKRTSAIVADFFRKNGLEVRTGYSVTGVLGILKGGKPGPVVAMRGDMDALPLTEGTGLAFASKVTAVVNGRETGLMHACGHDIHTTVLLGTAAALAAVRDELRGTILFIAQPGEECCAGAARMIDDGVLKDFKPEAIFAYHVDDTLKAGFIGYTSGFASANVDDFVLKIKSAGGHGADPSKCVDPIVVGAQIVTGLQVMISRQIDVQDNTIITVGAFHAGTADNIIPREAELRGTVRTYGETQRKSTAEKIKRLIAGTCGASGAEFELDYEFGLPSMFNNPDLLTRMLTVAGRVLGGDEALVDQQPGMGGEDFAYFSQAASSVMLNLGVVPPDLVATSVHSPLFVADEAAIPIGVNLMADIIIDRLSAGRR